MFKMKKAISLLASAVMIMCLGSGVFAGEISYRQDAPRRITFDWSELQSPNRSAGNNNEIVEFFTENQLDYGYYMDWLNSRETTNLDTVSFTISEQ